MKLSIENLKIYFKDLPLLDSITAEFESGCLNLIVGHSGCGKSTFLKILAGFHKDYKGSIKFEKKEFNPEGNIALAFQNPESLFFNSTVFDEISYSLKISGKSDIELTNSWMEKWGIEPQIYKDKYPFNLSGGEKRRVALAACTILNPNIILLDEPLAGLDRAGQSDLSSIINSLVKDHIVIIVTHEPELLIQHNSKILFLNNEKSTLYSSNEFLYKSVKDPNFYPLPEWYCNLLKDKANISYMPLVNAKNVADYLNK